MIGFRARRVDLEAERRGPHNEDISPRKGLPVIITASHSSARDIYAPNTELFQQRIEELVRAHLLETIGRGGSFTVTMRHSDDDDTFFSEIFAANIARRIAESVAVTHPVVIPMAAPRLVA